MGRGFVATAAVVGPLLGTVVLAACSPGGDASTATTQRLAPSQIAASTVARPDTLAPCDPDDLAWWTAQAMPIGADSSSAVVRVRNEGAVACEVDIAGSPTLGDDSEPNVWLEPGEWGELLVGTDTDRCSPTVFDEVEVVVETVPVVVPSIGVAACAPALLAFYVADTPAGPCDDVDLAVVDGVVVVRNASLRSCELGEVVGVDAERPPGGPLVTALAGGDVVAVDTLAVGEGCEAEATFVEFTVAGTFEVAGLSGCPVAGAARPWYGTGAHSGSVAAVLASLDPFEA